MRILSTLPLLAVLSFTAAHAETFNFIASGNGAGYSGLSRTIHHYQ